MSRRHSQVFVLTDDPGVFEAVRGAAGHAGSRWSCYRVSRPEELPSAISLTDWIISDAAFISRALPAWTSRIDKIPAQRVLVVDEDSQVAYARALGIGCTVHKTQLQSRLAGLIGSQIGTQPRRAAPCAAKPEASASRDRPISLPAPALTAAPVPNEYAVEVLALARRLFCLNREQMHVVCRDVVPALFGARLASLYGYDAPRRNLCLLWHTHERPIDAEVSLESTRHSPMTCAASERQIRLVEDWNRAQSGALEALARPNQHQYRTNSSIVAPIVLGAELLGVLNLADPRSDDDRRRSEQFDRRVDLPLAESLCALLASAWNQLRMYEQLEQEARTDGLTGLANYRAFVEQLNKEVTRARRYGSPLSLIMLDVDGLKQINDTAGHQAGDLMIRLVAQQIASGVRDIDVPARYGGDEFAVILPNTDLASARQVADRLAAEVYRSPAHWRARPLETSVSVGVGQYANQLTVEEFIRGIDLALYDAKAAGKNRVAVLQPS